jgi:hypothetical protein
VTALLRWASWKGLAIPCEPRLTLQSQVASESTINYDAVHYATFKFWVIMHDTQVLFYYFILYPFIAYREEKIAWDLTPLNLILMRVWPH